MSQPTVYILLPVHNRRQVTATFLEALLQQEYRHYHLVLIDDGSTDGTAEMVKALLPAATVIRGNGNWWWGGSLQQGYRWVKQNVRNPDDIILIANDDITFSPQYLGNAVEWLQNAGDALLLSRAYSRQTGKLRDVGMMVNWRRMTFEPAPDARQINCLSTRGLFLKAGTLLRTGGFRPLLLPHYASDYEFTIRARRKGFRLATHESVQVVMDETTTGTHTIRETSARNYLKKIFSRKAPGNPVYLTNFVLLSCPLPYIPLNVLRIWKGFLHDLFGNVRQRQL